MAVRKLPTSSTDVKAFTGSGQGPKVNTPNANTFNNQTGTPQFPGWQSGKDIEAVRNFNKNMVRRKGYRFSGGTTATQFQIKISGTAKFLLGIAWLNSTFSGFCTLQINNETVFENVDNGFFAFGATEQDYYAVNRPLSGQDDIILTVTGDVAYENQPFVVYYF